MPREKRPLSQDDLLDVEATCRAVKRLQITVACHNPFLCQDDSASHSNPDSCADDLIDGITASLHSALHDSATIEAAEVVQQSVKQPGKHLEPAAQLQQQSAERQALTPVRSPPQRSLSSPDMSRFKFRLTLSKPPVHPTSSGKIRRQLSLTDSIDDDEALLKTTSDRHCEQERLFHQLDQKLTLAGPPAAPADATNKRLMPSSANTSDAALQLKAASSKLPTSPASSGVPGTQQWPAVKDKKPSPLNRLAVEDANLLDEVGNDDVCQPGTPIRREDSIPVRTDEQQLIGEAVFAALYEQTNVLLRNLHFERVNRRASSS